MKLSLAHIRRIARLLAGAFAVQVIAAGACLMVPEAHAMPMPAAATVEAHCDNMEMAAGETATDMTMGHAMPMHGDHSGCPHCNQPDTLAVSHVDIDHATPLFLAVLTMPVALPVAVASDSGVDFRTPTGPPRSTSLLFRTTQRIRI